MREQAQKDKILLKQQFKDWFKPDAAKIRKANYIGDVIIVEKLDQEEEIESDEEEEEKAEGTYQ